MASLRFCIRFESDGIGYPQKNATFRLLSSVFSVSSVVKTILL